MLNVVTNYRLHRMDLDNEQKKTQKFNKFVFVLSKILVENRKYKPPHNFHCLLTMHVLMRYALVILVVCISEWQSQGRGCFNHGKCVLVHIAVSEYQLILTS